MLSAVIPSENGSFASLRMTFDVGRHVESSKRGPMFVARVERGTAARERD
jgi:hypothetical protein